MTTRPPASGPTTATSGAHERDLPVERVLDWGATHLRSLPWRATRDPWAVLAAEVMLQQTQVARVIDRWTEFLRRWPVPVDLAADPLADLLTFWQGLGYPRRARNLREAARVVVDRHGGTVPLDLDALLALPGVGPYTARAVLVFAGERPAGVVDTNIARVLARVQGSRLTARAAQTLADQWVPAARSWQWNQTLMDLGATLCRPAPICDHCPLGTACQWRQAGYPSPDPAERTAGVSGRQAPFVGSDRQIRGQILRALAVAAAPVDRADLVSDVAGADHGMRARVDRLVDALALDGLVSVERGSVALGADPTAP